MILKRLGKSDIEIAAIGQGCMGIGGELSAQSAQNQQQVDALRLGIELGMTFIDTAEVYGGGHSEELVRLAIRGVREGVFVATKFSPKNNSYHGVLQAAEGSLRRLGTEYLDLYQVHWTNPSIPIEETMKALSLLVRQGKVRHIGVSNFSVPELHKARSALSDLDISSNQVEYNLFDRFIEKRILPYCIEHRISVIAYSPLDKGRVGQGKTILKELADKYGKTEAQIVLNWLIQQPQVIAIPKASNPLHVRENAAAADFDLEQQDVVRIWREFSPEPALIETDAICVSLEGEGSRKVYQTLQQALDNNLNFVPSPRELAQDMKSGEPIKPVRLIPSGDASGRYKYDLIEGRIRYWAWVIAHGERPIPALIRSAR